MSFGLALARSVPPVLLQFEIYREQDPKTGFDLKALAMTGSERTTIPVANTRFEERDGQFSPDGRWVAYATDESGQFEIVVQPFPLRLKSGQCPQNRVWIKA